MKTALQVTSIIAIVFGALAILGGLVDADGYALIGGSMFAGQGIIALVYINEKK